MLEVGKTTLKQTPQFREAVKTCLTEGYAPLAIASAIHKIAIDDGHYSSECMGVGLNYEKIQATVSNLKGHCIIKNKQTVYIRYAYFSLPPTNTNTRCRKSDFIAWNNLTKQWHTVHSFLI